MFICPLVVFDAHQNQLPLPSPTLPRYFPISATHQQIHTIHLQLRSSASMKRSIPDSPVTGSHFRMKKIKEEEDDKEIGFMNFDENLLYEILKHVDAKTLAMSACVSKLWHKTAQDERLWELICTKHWANIGCGTQQLRSVVLPLGGFRRLHSLYLWPLSKPQLGSSSSSNWAPVSQMINSRQAARWGKDEVHLCLSLLSIQYYEKMNFTNRGGKL